ncbi:MAG: hypothetical protein WC998_00495 [Candidatus Paceibacterota bacterium]|jgi:hypothetical protein
MSIATIVGAGPNGEPFWKDVSTETTVMCCNAGIFGAEKFGWNASWWVMDYRIFNFGWAVDILKSKKYPLWGTPAIVDKLKPLGLKVDHLFINKPAMNVNSFQPIKGVYRGGGTIVGCPLHKCYWEGVDPILVGVDMNGNSNLTGTRYPPGHWNSQRLKLELFIQKYLPQTVSLSPTSLRLGISVPIVIPNLSKHDLVCVPVNPVNRRK